MIRFPKTVAGAVAALAQRDAVVRAGATDLSELRHLGIHTGPAVDLRDVPGLDGVEVTEDGGLRIGAMVTVRDLARHPQVRSGYPGLAAAAGGLATPQIRAQATVGGNLLQDVRCWYFRTDQFRCLKKGGATCLARQGDHGAHAPVDLGPCMAPHPSTLAVPLLALGARVEVEGAANRDLKGLMGDGGDARRTHTLPSHALLTHVVLPPPVVGARSAYHRTIQRSRSEWPLVEAFVHVTSEGGRITEARVALGGLANRPIRVPKVEEALAGLSLGGDASPAVASLRAWTAQAPGTETRLALAPITLLDTLALAAASPPAQALQGGSP